MATIEELQATYDRLVSYRGRLLRYYDEAPDGDPRKHRAVQQLTILGHRIIEVENQLDEAITKELF